VTSRYRKDASITFSVASLEEVIGRLFGPEDVAEKGMQSVQYVPSCPHRKIAGSTIGVFSLDNVIASHTTSQ
jgi:hypothetical protein